jgi:hypothetical protein
MRLVVLGILLGAAGLLAGCAATPPPPDPRSGGAAAGPAAEEGQVPRRARLRWRGISDERPPWLRDLPAEIERYRAPEDSTRASATSREAAIRS